MPLLFIATLSYSNCGSEFEGKSSIGSKGTIDVEIKGANGKSQVVEVYYEVHGGQVIVDGDMDIGDVSILETDKPVELNLVPQPENKSDSNIARQGTGKVNPYFKWGNVVFYKFFDASESEEDAEFKIFTQEEKEFVRNEFLFLNSQFTQNAINLSFREVSASLSGDELENLSYISIYKNQSSNFAPAGSATVGYRGNGEGVNRLILRVFNRHIVAHEVFHNLGLWHEHQHPERDRHIEFLTENFRDPLLLTSNNFKTLTDDANITGVDRDSIMMYASRLSLLSKSCVANKDNPLAWYDEEQTGEKVISGRPRYEDVEINGRRNRRITNIDELVFEEGSTCTVRSRYEGSNGESLPFMLAVNPMNGNREFSRRTVPSAGDYRTLGKVFGKIQFFTNISLEQVQGRTPACYKVKFNLKVPGLDGYSQYEHIDLTTVYQGYKILSPAKANTNLSSFTRDQIKEGVNIVTNNCETETRVLNYTLVARSEESENNKVGHPYLYGDVIIGTSSQFRMKDYLPFQDVSVESISDKTGVITSAELDFDETSWEQQGGSQGEVSLEPVRPEFEVFEKRHKNNCAEIKKKEYVQFKGTKVKIRGISGEKFPWVNFNNKTAGEWGVPCQYKKVVSPRVPSAPSPPPAVKKVLQVYDDRNKNKCAAIKKVKTVKYGNVQVEIRDVTENDFPWVNFKEKVNGKWGVPCT